MNESDRPILICYDGSDEAHRAIAAAANLLPGRSAVVLNVAPPLLPEQSYEELFAPAVPDFAQDNARMARERAEGGPSKRAASASTRSPLETLPRCPGRASCARPTRSTLR